MLEIRPASAEDIRVATSGGSALPLEQSSVWQKFSTADGHPLARRFIWEEDGKVIAVASFYRHSLRGFPFLWAKRGPVWLKEATPEREKELRDSLRVYLRKSDPTIVFVRMHATYAAQDMTDPMRVIGYDRTVVIDGARGDRDAALAIMPKDGRRTVTRARKKMEQMGGTIQQEFPSSTEFAEYYSMLEETAARDGFTPHPRQHYWNFLDCLGENARLYSARVDGELAAWDLVGVNGAEGTAFYGASSQLSRQAQAVPALDFEIACLLGEEGLRGLDLMGIHSPRTPELFAVGKYKSKFAASPEDVPGLWDVPVRTLQYRALKTAYKLRASVKRSSTEAQ